MNHRPFSVLLALGLVVVGLAFASSARACRCREPATSRAYKAAELVVLARVVAVQPGNAPGVVTIQLAVQAAWKTDCSERLFVTTGDPCAYPAAADEIHLLFIKHTSTGELATARCFGNGPVAARGGALEWLRHHGERKTINTRSH